MADAAVCMGGAEPLGDTPGFDKAKQTVQRL